MYSRSETKGCSRGRLLKTGASFLARLHFHRCGAQQLAPLLLHARLLLFLFRLVKVFVLRLSPALLSQVNIQPQALVHDRGIHEVVFVDHHLVGHQQRSRNPDVAQVQHVHTPVEGPVLALTLELCIVALSSHALLVHMSSLLLQAVEGLVD